MNDDLTRVDTLAKVLYDIVGWHAADSWACEDSITQGQYQGIAEGLLGSSWLADTIATAHDEGAAEANAVRDRNFGNLRWMDGYEYGLDDGRFEVKRAAEEWFTDISLDDLYAVKGWSTHKVGSDGLTDVQRQESLDNFQRNVGHKPQRRNT